MFSANVLRVMIASPGDVKDEREIVTKEIYRWNDAHAFSRRLLLQPVKWETHSTPRMGATPQDVLNEQIVDDADILVGVFGTRVGTATEKYISGTVEEIRRHVAAGKTAKVYFSDVPVSPSEIDPEQYKALQEFKEECRKGGLYATYTFLDAFRELFQQHLAIELNQPRYLWLSEPAPPTPRKEGKLSPKDAKSFEVSMAIKGGASSQSLGVISNKQITLRQLEFLTTAGACAAHEDLDSVETEEFEIPIDHLKVVKLFNAPRGDRTPNDHSGPALLRLTYTRSGRTSTLDLPVILRPVFLNTGNGSTQYINLEGQKRFYLNE